MVDGRMAQYRLLLSLLQEVTAFFSFNCLAKKEEIDNFEHKTTEIHKNNGNHGNYSNRTFCVVRKFPSFSVVQVFRS